jgi:hypothetical protein
MEGCKFGQLTKFPLRCILYLLQQVVLIQVSTKMDMAQ